MTELPYSRLPGAHEGPRRIEESVRAGLDADYQRSVAEQVADALDLGRTVEVDYQPGDMTRYPLVFTPLDANVVKVGPLHAWPGTTTGENGHEYEGSWALVSLGGGFNNCYVFNLAHGRGELHPDYIGEKLDIRSYGSALALADLFTAIAAARKP